MFPKRAVRWTVAIAFALQATFVAGSDYFVAPGGSAGGPGSFGSPWNLQTALNQPSAVHPGDTIWLRGGTYQGIYNSNLVGTPSAPIIVRQYPGERATIDGGSINTPVVLTISGAYTWFWGFEVTSSSLDRLSTDTGSYPLDLNRPYEGIANSQQAGSGVGTKFINLVVHNLGQGFGFWQDATDAEIHGCLIYYNGWDAPDRGHGHGIYTQNQTGTKTIKNNIIFANFSHGLHAYGSGSAHLNNYRVEGNTLFQNDVLSAVSGGRNLLIGGESGNVAQNPNVISNSLYRPVAAGNPTTDFDLGFGGGCANPQITNNYIADNTLVNCSSITMTGNTFYGTVAGFSPSSFPSNTYFSSRPTGSQVFVRPNQYEAGRANITVFNWGLTSTVNADLSSVLPVGATYKILNAQNYFAPPVLSGTYAGGTVSLPMTGLSVEIPVGVAAPPATGPEFNVFILIQTAPPATTFYTVTPCRLVDTRGAIGPLGGPALVASTDRTFVITNQCTIPSTATALSLNVAVTQSTTGPGFLTVHAGGTPPPAAATINYKSGQTRANNVIAAVGPSGDVKVYCGQGSGSVHVIIDVNGYFQ